MATRAATDDAAKEMADQMKRLEAQVAQGKIKAVNAAEVGSLLTNGWHPEDVRSTGSSLYKRRWACWARSSAWPSCGA